MPDPITPDFETVRWKLAEDMNDQDISVLMENKDKLNEEEKAAFSNIIQENTPLPDDPLSQAIEDAVKDPVIDDTPEEPIVPEEKKEAAPIMPENVVTQEKLDSYMDAKRKEWEAAGKSETEQKKEEEKIQKLFEDGYEPKDWNDYSMQFLEKAAPLIEKRIMDRLTKESEEKAAQTKQFNDEAKKVYDSFEAEFADLATKNLIPKQGTDEFKKVHDQIIALGDANGKRNITDAYNLWKIIPVEHGGGLVIGNAPVVDQNKQIQLQKERAGRIGKGTGSATPTKGGPPSWATIHNTNMDDLIEQRLQQS